MLQRKYTAGYNYLNIKSIKKTRRQSKEGMQNIPGQHPCHVGERESL